MKKFGFFAIFGLICFMAVAVAAGNETLYKFYKPLSASYAPGSYKYVEIPERAVVPSYISRLQTEAPLDYKSDDGVPVIVVRFFDPACRYLLDTEDLVYPLVEIFRVENGIHHLVNFAFVSDAGEVEIYCDISANSQPAKDRLEYATPDFLRGKKIQKIPR